ncbi:MAG: hypothetical protein R2748_19685 [Bryobacterales bacterium]
MAGQLLMIANDLRVIADQPEAPGDTGVVIPQPGQRRVASSEPVAAPASITINTVYASFIDVDEHDRHREWLR